MVNNPPPYAGNIRNSGLIPESGRALEEEMAMYTSTLPGRVPWTEEPERLQFMGSAKSRPSLK